jgi:predicted ATPase
LVATQGYAAPEVEQIYTRAYTLCQQVGDIDQRRAVLLGLWRVYSMRGTLKTAREVAEQLLDLAQRGNDPFQLVEAHRAMGVVLFWLGDLTAACTHLEQGWALYDRQRDAYHAYHSGPDVGVSCLSMATTPLWMLGYPDRAAVRSEQAIALAQELHHPFSLAFALVNATRLSHFRREWHRVQAQAEAIQQLSTEHHFAFWHAVGMRWHGVALMAQGRTEDGIALIHQGHTAYQANGTTTGESYYRLLLAEAYREAGQVEHGLQVMHEALAAFDKAEDRLYEAEMYRLKGELLLGSRTTPLSEVEACFRQALAVARRQQAKSLELRAAMSLVQLGQGHGARDTLANVYHWFTEGFDTADLQEARARLEEYKGLISGD